MRIIILVFLSSYFIQGYAQCSKADEYDAKMKKIENMTPTERVNTGSDMQGFIQFKAWYSLKCECDKGWYIEKATNTKKWRTPEQAEAIKNNMNAIRQTISNLYSNLGSVPLVINPCKCGNSAGGTTTNNGTVNTDPKAGVMVNDEYLGLLNDIASESKNPNFKTMVNDMNQNSEIVGKGRYFALQTGTMKAGDVDYYNNLENIAQGVAVGKFIINSFSNKSVNKEVQLNAQQRAATTKILDIRNDLYHLHAEISRIPTFYDFNENTIEQLSKIEKKIENYNNVTASRRLLYFEYWENSRVTLAELNSNYNKIINLEEQEGVDYIISLINTKSKEDVDPFYNCLLNSEIGFKSTYNRINLIKAKCYKKLGQTAKANELLTSIDYNIDFYEAAEILPVAFYEKNYFSSIQYYSLMKQTIIEKEKNYDLHLAYREDIGRIVLRTDVAYFISIGALSYLTQDNLTQAYEELLFLKKFNKDYADFIPKYNGGATITSLNQELNHCKMAELIVESKIYAKTGDEKSLELINKAIEINANNGGLLDMQYNLGLKLQKVEILVQLNKFSEAKKIALSIRQTSLYNVDNTEVQMLHKFYDYKDYRFLLAFMKYKEGKLSSALNLANRLEKEFPEMSRAKYLKLQIQEDIKVTK